MRYLIAGQSEKGKRKGVNQDSILLVKDLFFGQEYLLAVVCDGMGGLKSGELASKAVVRFFSEWFEKTVPEILTEQNEEEFEDRLYDSWEVLLQNVHEKIKKYGHDNGIQIGTTVTALFLWGAEYYIAHIGDSRIYEINQDVVQLTRDQTLSCFEKQGTQVNEDAKKKNSSGVLLQGVGASEKIYPVYVSGKAKEKAVYLLCSDGFRHLLSSSELAEWFCPEEMPDEKSMAEKLDCAINAIRNRGEKDDISVLLIRTAND
ncbi:hypothetical protein B5F07_08715 [Lachnoclostridium sp. An169]|uniref:PP2C family protein-serine/threonine phosphatase n=1 Tax=Lachnoclostridium sp. An169 TaxID=1965569 RepID=UPI000B36D933|nr:PP2C family serine/threonine-protein phosphatase [Lachnoclostridium sp. An169]OUP84208.1 hypothetical protein B5F07_08715 [Lachnoclostridium sp. An169]